MVLYGTRHTKPVYKHVTALYQTTTALFYTHFSFIQYTSLHLSDETMPLVHG